MVQHVPSSAVPVIGPNRRTAHGADHRISECVQGGLLARALLSTRLWLTLLPPYV